jgi:Domain of unknown function (DUF4112)
MTHSAVQTRSAPQVERLRTLARLLDTVFPIPGTKYRFGLDAVIGLIPGIGDAIGALFSAVIVFQAARLGASRSILLRMLANLGLDTLIGEIPLLGDLFDAGWKANIRNMALLEEHLQQPSAARRGSRRVLLMIGGALILLLAVVVALAAAVVNLVVRELH